MAESDPIKTNRREFFKILQNQKAPSDLSDFEKEALEGFAGMKARQANNAVKDIDQEISKKTTYNRPKVISIEYRRIALAAASLFLLAVVIYIAALQIVDIKSEQSLSQNTKTEKPLFESNSEIGSEKLEITKPVEVVPIPEKVEETPSNIQLSEDAEPAIAEKTVDMKQAEDLAKKKESEKAKAESARLKAENAKAKSLNATSTTATPSSTREVTVTTDESYGNKDKFSNISRDKKETVVPQYPGGTDELKSFIARNLKYPIKSKKDNVEGRVLVSFIIEENGKISNAMVKQSLNDECDAAALKVISKMPRWKPGMEDGKANRMMYTVPVDFKLEK